MQATRTKPVAEQQTQKSREIQYMFSKSPTNLVPLVGDLLFNVMHASNQWASERRTGELTMECLMVLIPEGQQDWAGRRQAAQIIDKFRMQRTWSASPSHLSPPPHGQQELGMTLPS
ncbi:hypothetical protein EMCG_08651 [[Emmonsia] crescens]|uniref:Uncharacterized protein n=1 Tax=[Emmonsia] crescens TaxID=73230 RepID=A0A0G2I4I1_9EURO|nr:hypothetical protein EMCG_08651 [Emmonsia crescens UAMH 3008]